MDSAITHPFWQNLFRRSQRKTDKIANLWLETALFEGIGSRRCRSLIRAMHIRKYQTNEAVFNQGEVGIGAALIIKGNVQIRTGSVLLAELSEGDFFGEVALVLDEPRTADAIASKQTDITVAVARRNRRIYCQIIRTRRTRRCKNDVAPACVRRPP